MAMSSRQAHAAVAPRAIHTSTVCAAATGATWGGGKQKSHSGTAKRFFPVGKRRVLDQRHPVVRDPVVRQMYTSLVREGLAPASVLSPQRKVGVMFKRGHTGTRHLNSKMSARRRMRLRGTALIENGPKAKVLSRLLIGRT